MTAIINADIVIVGAGLIGLTASVALARAGYSVTIVDTKDPKKAVDEVAIDSWDKRIYAISPQNAVWLKSLDVWEALDISRIGKMCAMEIWGDENTQPLYLSAEDVNADGLGFIVEDRALTKALLDQLNVLPIRTLFGETCKNVVTSCSKAKNVTLSLTSGTIVEAKILLAADGANSWVRQQLNFPNKQKPYHQQAIVANFKCEKSHADIARQWFAKDTNNLNSILAWLPLPDNTISIVWSVSNEHAKDLLALPDEVFTEEVANAGMHALASMKLITSPASFPLMLQKADSLLKNSVVLVGDAAHQIHPMAGQGMNLGFRDIADLIEILASKHSVQSINDTSLLRTYERKRKEDVAKMLCLTNGLFNLFGSPNSAIKYARNQGLRATNYLPIKKLLVESAISL